MDDVTEERPLDELAQPWDDAPWTLPVVTTTCPSCDKRFDLPLNAWAHNKQEGILTGRARHMETDKVCFRVWDVKVTL